jgi:cyclophilin family peptidyl-prolyl cis-trans isomerase/HEAT repeat protein
MSVISAEDARPTDGEALELLIASSRVEDPLLRALAVRALGRLENPDHIGRITPLLSDPDAPVRAAAAHALAQAVHGTSGRAVLETLITRADEESDADVRRELARSLGRLNLGPENARRAVSTLVGLGTRPDVSPTALVGVALALEALSRSQNRTALDASVVTRLESFSSFGLGGGNGGVEAPRIRTLAVAALGQLGQLGADLLGRALEDPNAQVRNAALRFGNVLPSGEREELYRRALTDVAPTVRVSGVVGLAAAPRTAAVCSALLVAAITNEVEAVRVLASDALGDPCDLEEQRGVLTVVASDLPPGGSVGWQAPARALLSLARIDARRGETLLSRYIDHPNHFVRAYAATAAGILGTESALQTLATDEQANVRTAALQPLFTSRGHAIDDLLVDQLSSDDPQLLMLASSLLAGSTLGIAAASSALDAFERISAAQRETWRDSRKALLERIGELGNASLASRLEPFLGDYDPVVAADVADLLTAWTGATRAARPQALPSNPLPTVTELRELARTTVTLRMDRGGEIVIRPLAGLAPTNAFRFVRLARSGYFDGLTFHRWAPNFVIQGGSPGANEYSGDAAYSRDEVGRLSHWRGTVGLSTRGHDTGDGQIFINLIDNVRLDHDYTIYGEVVSGMDVVDAVLEGDVIERAEVRVGP